MALKPIESIKAELHFPLEWEFRVIVEAQKAESARLALSEVLAKFGKKADWHAGLNSKNGRYLTFKTALVLSSKAMMEELAADLAAVEGVKFVL